MSSVHCVLGQSGASGIGVTGSVVVTSNGVLIEGLRAAPARGRPAPPAELERSPSNVLRELAAQLADEKRRRREEVAALEAALAAAHGELLDLRRRASARHVA